MDLDLRAGDQMGDLRLLEVGVDIELVDRHERGQSLASGNEVTDLDGDVADDAVIGRLQDGEAEVAVGLVTGKFERADLAFRL